MTVVYWIAGVVAYFAIAVLIMRWRTWRINQGKSWRIVMESEYPTPRQRQAAHNWTAAVGLFWPIAFVFNAFVEALFVALWYVWLGIDWTMRKAAGLPPRK